MREGKGQTFNKKEVEVGKLFLHDKPTFQLKYTVSPTVAVFAEEYSAINKETDELQVTVVFTLYFHGIDGTRRIVQIAA